ncbi:MAG: hypothetical protein ABIJ09_24420 [Pseudomonadota bacterium]
MAKVTNNSTTRTQPSKGTTRNQQTSTPPPPPPANKAEAEKNLRSAQQVENKAVKELQKAERGGDEQGVAEQQNVLADAVRNREACQRALDTVKGADAQQTQSELQSDRFVPQGQNPSDWQTNVSSLALRSDHSAIFNGMEVAKPTTPEEKAQAVSDINQRAEKYKGKSFDELVTTVSPQEKAEFLSLYGVGFQGPARDGQQAEKRGHQLNKTFAEVVAGLQSPGRSSVKTQMMGGRGHEIHMDIASDGAGHSQLEGFQVKKVKKKGFFSKVGDSIKKYSGALLTVASFIPGPVGIAARIGQAVSGAYTAVKNKDWLGGVASVAGGAASGITAMAGKALSGTTATVAATARAVERGARAVQAGTAAYRSGDAGAILGAVAAGAGGVAGAIGGVAGGTAATFEQVAGWASRGATAVHTVEAARQGDVLAAVAGGASLGADLAGQDRQLGRTLGTVGDVAATAHRVHQGLESGDYAGAAAAVSGLASREVKDPARRQQLATTARVLGDASTIQRSLDGGDVATALKAAGDLDSALSGDSDGVLRRVREDIDTIRQAHDDDDMEALRAGFRRLGKDLKDDLADTRDRYLGHAEERVRDRHVQQGARSVRLSRGLSNAGRTSAASMGSSLGAASVDSVSPALPASQLASDVSAERARLEASASFTRLTENQQKRALALFDRSEPQAQQSLVELTDRQIAGRTALLNRDSSGKTLQSNLQQLARDQPPSVVNAILQEVAEPTQINQGSHETCSTASMQYLLCQNNPAEYVRVMNGLMSKDGRVTMANGDELRCVPDSLTPDKSTDRSASERVFQAAMMDYSNGSNDYSNRADAHARTPGGRYTRQGLHADEVKRGLEALTGKTVDIDYNNPIPALFKGGKLGTRMARDFSGETLVELEIPVAGKKDANGRWIKPHTYPHAVTVTEIRNGRVYFKNSQMPGLGSREALDLPSHRVENRRDDHGIESMSIEDFNRCAAAAFEVK